MAIQNSVFTNPSAFTALRALNSVNRRLDVTQNRVSTGLRVSSSLDDASAFAVAQGIRGELRALESISQGLNNSKAVGKVAVTGATASVNSWQQQDCKWATHHPLFRYFSYCSAHCSGIVDLHIFFGVVVTQGAESTRAKSKKNRWHCVLDYCPFTPATNPPR